MKCKSVFKKVKCERLEGHRGLHKKYWPDSPDPNGKWVETAKCWGPKHELG